MCIGYVKKCNIYGTLQPHILINLLNSYCCSLCGSKLWKYNSESFDKICKSWNIAIITLLRLPFNTPPPPISRTVKIYVHNNMLEILIFLECTYIL